LELTRYIHLNPLRAGIVKDMDALDVYPWTGHAVIIGNQHYPWRDRDTVLSCFSKTEGEARERYHRFVEEGIARGKRTDLTGGGLLRSQGGWAEVVSMRRRNVPAASDGRILGSSAFVGTVLGEAEEKKNAALRSRAGIPELAAPADLIGRKENVSLTDLLSGRRTRRMARARRIFCQMAVTRLFHSGASVARFLGLTTSLVNRMAKNEEATDLDAYLKSSL
jgi:hypothetical protein